MIQSIPAYSMNVFKLPVSLCKVIKAMIRKFWWESGEGKKIHWVKWSTLCSSKSIGAMGFRDINNFNDAMLAKQIWRLLHKKNTLLYKVFSAKYFLGGNILDAPTPTKCSYAWKSILQSRKVIQKGAIWRVGDGWRISIWEHSWLPTLGMSRVVSPKIDVGLNRVCDLLYPGTKIWNVEVL